MCLRKEKFLEIFMAHVRILLSLLQTSVPIAKLSFVEQLSTSWFLLLVLLQFVINIFINLIFQKLNRKNKEPISCYRPFSFFFFYNTGVLNDALICSQLSTLPYSLNSFPYFWKLRQMFFSNKDMFALFFAIQHLLVLKKYFSF